MTVAVAATVTVRVDDTSAGMLMKNSVAVSVVVAVGRSLVAAL